MKKLLMYLLLMLAIVSIGDCFLTTVKPCEMGFIINVKK